MSRLLRYIVGLFALCLMRFSVEAQIVDSAQVHWFDSVSRCLRLYSDDTNKLNIIEQIATQYSNVDTIIKYANEGLALAKKLNSNKHIISAYRILGRSHYYSLKFGDAVQCFKEALTIAEQTNNRREVGLCYHNIAAAMAMMNDYEKADEYDYLALKVFYELDDSVLISEIYRTLGYMCVNYNLYETAKRHFHQSLEIDLKQGDSTKVANDYLYFSIVDQQKFKYSKIDSLIFESKNYIRKSHDLLTKNSNEWELLIVCQTAMSVFFDCAIATEGKQREILLDSSKMFYNKGKEIAQKSGFFNLSYEFRFWEVSYHLFRKEYSKAYQILAETEKQVNDNPMLQHYGIENDLLFHYYYINKGDYKKAYEYLCLADSLDLLTIDNEYAIKATNSSVQNEFTNILHKLYFNDAQANLQRQLSEHRRKMINYGAIVFCVFLGFVAIFIMRNIRNKSILGEKLKQSYAKMEQQRNQLANVNNQITSSINYAQRIQNSMVPSSTELSRIFGDTLIYWKPLNIVSGDFYWATQVGNQKLFTIADCTGHGVPGAFMSILGISTLCDVTSSVEFLRGNVTAAAILNMLRDKVIESLRQSEDSGMSLDGMDMALCIINEATLTMQYAGAFRPIVIIRDGEVIELKADKMPVSFLTTNNKSFTNNIYQLRDNDVVYMFSDGITDQFGHNQSGKEQKFSAKRLYAILQQIYKKPFNEQKVIINDMLFQWRTSGGITVQQTDDIILTGFRIDEQFKNSLQC